MTEENNNHSSPPKGWTWTRLGEIGNVAAGGTPSTNDPDNFDGDIPWVTPADLSDFKGKLIERGKRNLSQKGLNSSSAVLLPAGTVLFSSRAPIGYVAIASNPVSTNQGFKNLSCYEGIFNEYVFYYLKASKRLAESFGSGTTFKEVSASRFARIPIPLCPTNEQGRIVSRVEELFSVLDAGVESLRKVRAQLKRYRQAVLKHAFEGKLTEEWRRNNDDKVISRQQTLELIEKSHQGIIEERAKTGKRTYESLVPLAYKELPEIPPNWVWVRLEEVVYVIDYRGRTPPFSSKGIPHLRSSNIREGKIIWDDLKYIAEETYQKYMVRGLPRKGDLLFSTEAPLGEFAFVPDERFSLAQRVVIFRPAEDLLNTEFLFYQLMSQRFKTRLMGRGTGTTVTGVSYRNLRQVELVIPPLEEQKTIVDEIERRLSVMESITGGVGNSLSKAEKLMSSILRRAFEGKLVPQDPADEPAEKLLERIKEKRARQMLEKGTNKIERRKETMKDAGLMHYVE